MCNKPLYGLLVFLLTACAVSPTGRQQLLLMNSQQINTMGVQAFNQLKQTKPIDTDPRVNAYVQCVAQAITLSMRWRSRFNSFNHQRGRRSFMFLRTGVCRSMSKASLAALHWGRM